MGGFQAAWARIFEVNFHDQPTGSSLSSEFPTERRLREDLGPRTGVASPRRGLLKFPEIARMRRKTKARRVQVRLRPLERGPEPC